MPTRIDTSSIPKFPDLSFESALWVNMLKNIAGLDEAGRGAWAGPVVGAAVILPNLPLVAHTLYGVRDSKQLSPDRRALLAPLIKQHALSWGVGFSDNHEIDLMGILPATRLAMMRAIQVLAFVPDHLLIDALFLPDLAIGQTSLIKGDQRSLSIAAASILAKTARDEWMIGAHSKYPQYQFDHHKAYGTKLHRERLLKFGKCDLHRVTYQPIRELDESNKKA
jgi:ribonuclease HII